MKEKLKWFGLFSGNKNVKTKIPFDPAVQKPILMKSICTGETTAGFKDLATGKYTDVMLIRDAKDLDEFRGFYGITGEIDTEY